MAVEAVVYDIGNVLIQWLPETYYDRTYGRERRERLFSEIDLHGMNLAVDMGEDFRGTIYAWADRHPEWRAEIRDWHDNWLELASPVIEGSVRLMRALKARGVPVHILSNIGGGVFDLAASRHAFLGEFDKLFLSGNLRLAKPDPAIYAAVEQGAGVPADRLLFVDDKADNIATAISRDWQGHVFDGPEGWAKRLVAEGLLTEKEAA